jgi:hypothetical protein
VKEPNKPKLTLVDLSVTPSGAGLQQTYHQLRDIPSDLELPCANHSAFRRLLNRGICTFVLGHEYELLPGIFVNRYACRHCAHELTR